MSSGFVSEAEIAEAKKKRQEEWEQVRQPNQPLERPEEEHDSRSLYERLKEQKDKKDYEFDEAHKLKNLIRGLDDDEVDFLDVIDRAKMDADKKQQLEERNELRDFRQKVASLQEKSITDKLHAEVSKSKPKITNISSRPSQKSILAGLVRKRKVSNNLNDDVQTEKLLKVEKSNGSNAVATESKIVDKNVVTGNVDSNNQETTSNPRVTTLHCIGILPGIGKYEESSDSDKSTDTDEEYEFSSYDWIGRQIQPSSKTNESSHAH